jgi:hypothetical protein
MKVNPEYNQDKYSINMTEQEHKEEIINKKLS